MEFAGHEAGPGLCGSQVSTRTFTGPGGPTRCAVIQTGQPRGRAVLTFGPWSSGAEGDNALRDSAGAEQSHHACPSCLLSALCPPPPLPCTCSEAQKGGSGCVVRPGVTVLRLERAGARHSAVGWPCWKAGCTHHARRQTPVTVHRGPSPPAHGQQNARPLWGQQGVGSSLRGHTHDQAPRRGGARPQCDSGPRG